MIREITLENTHLTRLGSKMTGNELTIAGMMVGVKRGVTKGGSPYGIIKLQDYTDTYNLSLFNADYIRYAKYFTEGYLLMIRGEFQPRYNNSKEMEFKVSGMRLLQGIRKDLKKLMIDSITKRIEDGRAVRAKNGTTE